MSDSTVPQLSNVSKKSVIAGALLLLFVLLLCVPQVLRMPLTNDTVYYDLQAECIQNGGVLYRDMFEPNFPGVVWLHVAVRKILGRSSEAIRCFDLWMLTGTVVTLAAAVRRLGGNAVRSLLAATAICWFYFSLREWCHCQRDPWLLLPAVLGVTLRERQLNRLRSNFVAGRELFLAGVLEGAVWGLGVWLKPHLILPAAAVWLITAWISRAPRLRIMMDFASCALGGGVIGVAGIAWLMASGTWPHFWETMLDWNPLYVAAVRKERSKVFVFEMVLRFLPWLLLHLYLLPWAVMRIVRQMRPALPTNSGDTTEGVSIDERLALWSSLYLVWIFQATFLQIVFDYVHVPGVMLAIMFTAARFPSHLSLSKSQVTLRAGQIALALGVVAAVWVSPLWRSERLALWPTCVTSSANPELWNQLRRVRQPDWVELEAVARFLENENVATGDVVTFDNHLIHLFWRLRTPPKIRFVYQEVLRRLFPNRIQVIQQDLAEHPPKFVVADLDGLVGPQISKQPGPRGELDLPAIVPARVRSRFPWNCAIVFRSGGMLVMRYEPETAAPAASGLRSRADSQ